MIKAAVVGLGWWGLKIVSELKNSAIDVILAVDPDRSARRKVEQAGVQAADDFAAALAADVDAIVLCTPHKLHAEQVMHAVAAGKHVFCEKPFTTTGALADRVLGEAERYDRVIGVGHERRFEKPVVELRRQIKDGLLGTPLVFEGNFSQDRFLALPPGNWRLSPDESPVGPLSATGIHLVDLAVSFFGRPLEVWSHLGRRDGGFSNGDALTVTIRFPNDLSALLTASLASPFMGRMAILGDLGWMEICDRSHPDTPQGWTTTRSLRDSDLEIEEWAPHSAVLDNLESFAAAVEGSAPYPVSHEEISATAHTFEAITKSALIGSVQQVKPAASRLLPESRTRARRDL